MKFDRKETEKVEDLSFINLRLGDKIFVLDPDLKDPKILTVKLFAIAISPIKDMQLKGNSDISQRDLIYIIQEEELHQDHAEHIFLKKEDCVKEFEKFCVQQIAELSKAIKNMKEKLNNE